MSSIDTKDLIYYVGRSDLQNFAEERIGRRLTEKELELAVATLERSFMYVEQGVEEFVQLTFGESYGQ